VYLLYSFVLTIGFLLLSPRFLYDAVRHGKYAAGFWQRFGYLPHFNPAGRKVIWLHCVSVGETQAARPLAQAVLKQFPSYTLVVSTTTKTGQNLAQNLFKHDAALVFYFPFDWSFVVRRVLRHIKPSLVLIMETELWFNFLREAKRGGAKIALINGRLSEKSFKNYSLIRSLMENALSNLDLALMSGEADAERLINLGCDASKVVVTGNVKFDMNLNAVESDLTQEFRDRFAFAETRPLIVAASTHETEEKCVLEAFLMLKDAETRGRGDAVTFNTEISASPRPFASALQIKLMLVPRHPERFDRVAELLEKSGLKWIRRSAEPKNSDRNADVILLDSIGELRAMYPLAEIVFVGGSLIPHGGQNILEPAAAGKPVVTGFYTMNFAAIVKKLLDEAAIVQLPELKIEDAPAALEKILAELLNNAEKRESLVENAFAVLKNNAGATERTVEQLKRLT
jgi:3-deoxy-D-manno-octulosonic-acid transferase